MSIPDPAVPVPDSRVAASLEAWKRKLLDLTKRNRALNFKATRVSAIRIVDEKPPEVFGHLYLQELPMGFAAAQNGGQQRALTRSVAANDASTEPSTPDLFEQVVSPEPDAGRQATSLCALWAKRAGATSHGQYAPDVF